MGVITGALKVIGIHLIAYSQVAAIMTLFQIEETYQAAMMMAFCMEVSGSKNYVPIYLDALEEHAFPTMNRVAEGQYLIAPYAAHAFEVFFYNAKLAIRAFRE